MRAVHKQLTQAGRHIGKAATVRWRERVVNLLKGEAL